MQLGKGSRRNWGRRVIDFYKIFSPYIVEPCDLRSYIVKRNIFGGITHSYLTKVYMTESRVDLGKDSLLEELYTPTKVPKFRS